MILCQKLYHITVLKKNDIIAETKKVQLKYLFPNPYNTLNNTSLKTLVLFFLCLSRTVRKKINGKFHSKYFFYFNIKW